MKVLERVEFRAIDTNDHDWREQVADKKAEVNGFLSSHGNCYDSKLEALLTFSDEITMRYGRKYFAQETSSTHRIKKFFGAYRSGLCYTAGRMKSRGWGVPYGFYEKLVSIEIVQLVEDYSTQWANIAKSMRKHGINLNIADYIDAHLRGEEEHIRGFQNYWTKKDKPRRMSFKDVLDHALVIGATSEVSIEHMKKVANENKYFSHRMYSKSWNMNKGRDRSISLELRNSGGYLYTGASEYAGCGNGDYYCMYSPTMSFYMETD